MPRRHRRRSTHHRRRRVSGVKGSDLKMIGLAVAGGIVGSKLSGMLAKSTNTTIANLSSYASLGVGILLPMVVKDQTVKQIANGMAIVGAIEALKKLAPGIVSGPYRLPVVAGRPRVSGGAFSPGMVGTYGGFSPANNSAVHDALKVISGAGIS